MQSVVVGSGPNGLAAAIVLARRGIKTTVFEGQRWGARSAALTLPGFVHDVRSAVYPMAVSSAAYHSFHLERFGVEWVHPGAPLAHPFDDGTAAVLDRSVKTTAFQFRKDKSI